MKAHHHSQPPSAELAQIMQEVKQHGFYVTQLDEFLPEIKSIEERMYVICVIAKQAQLKVSFNLDKNLCVLEWIKLTKQLLLVERLQRCFNMPVFF